MRVGSSSLRTILHQTMRVLGLSLELNVSYLFTAGRLGSFLDQFDIRGISGLVRTLNSAILIRMATI